MSDQGGLRGIWEDFRNFLDVNIEVEHVNSHQDNPVLVKFTVTNTGQAQDDRLP